MPDLKLVYVPNPNIVKELHASRNSVLQTARNLDAEVRGQLGESDILRQFTAADLKSSAASFSFGDLAAKFKGRYGITDSDLSLTEDEIDKLPKDTDEQRKKKVALLLKLELEAFAQQVRERYLLWQQQIMFGALLENDPSLGAKDDGILSPDDLVHLSSNSTVRALTVLDEKNFPPGVQVTLKDGKATFTVNANTKPQDIRIIVNNLAATGCDTLTIDCREANDLDQYTMMGEEAILEIFRNGLPIKVVANEPGYVTAAKQGTMRTNPQTGQREPQDSRKREAYHAGIAEQQFFQDMSRNMPQNVATAADTGARMAITYSGLMEKNKGRFLQLFASDPEMQLKISDMAGHFLRTGQMDKLVELQRDVKQHLNMDMFGVVEQAITDQMDENAGMTKAELHDALNNFYRSNTLAGRNFELLAVNGVASPPMMVILTMIGKMSVKQMEEDAVLLAQQRASDPARFRIGDNHEGMVRRAGMMLVHGNEEQREAFTKAYLEEAHRLACEKHGVKPGEVGRVPVVPATTPPTMRDEEPAEREARYAGVQADVQAAAAELLQGTNEYAKYTGFPNAKPLDHVLAASRSTVESLAHQRFEDMAGCYPVPARSTAEGADYVDAAMHAFNRVDVVAKVAGNAAGQRQGEFAPDAVPVPHHRI